MAQQQETNAPNKPVHLIYLIGVVAAFYVLQWSIDWIWGYFGTPPSEFKISLMSAVVAFVAGIVLYRNDRVYTLANEVAGELKKVTWPTWKEVWITTLMVLIMVSVASVFFLVVDQVLGHAVNFVLRLGS